MFYILKINPASILKNNTNREKKVIPLMIPNGNGHQTKSEGRWHYLATKHL